MFAISHPDHKQEEISAAIQFFRSLQQLRRKNSGINSSRPTQSIFCVGILSARAGWMVTSFSESVQSIQLFIPSEEKLSSRLHFCPDLFHVFTLLPVRIDLLALEAHGHGSRCHFSGEKRS